MEKIFLVGFFTFSTLTFVGCKHSSKDTDTNIASIESTTNDDVVKRTVFDRHGDKMDIVTNNSKNTIIIRLNGISYDLKKNAETQTYSTSDNMYQFVETRNDISFIKKNIDMVLFHTKKEKK